MNVEIKEAAPPGARSIRLFRDGVPVGSPRLVAADATDGGTFTMQVPLLRGKAKLQADDRRRPPQSAFQGLRDQRRRSRRASRSVAHGARAAAAAVPRSGHGHGVRHGRLDRHCHRDVRYRTGHHRRRRAATVGNDFPFPRRLDVDVQADAVQRRVQRQRRAHQGDRGAVGPERDRARHRDTRGTGGGPGCEGADQGSGAHPNGKVVVAAGTRATDPEIPNQQEYFVPIATLTPASNGTFSGYVDLDAGHHELRIFQRMNGLDGPFLSVLLYIRPPLGSLTITEFISDGETIPADLATGLAPRSGSEERVGCRPRDVRHTSPSSMTGPWVASTRWTKPAASMPWRDLSEPRTQDRFRQADRRPAIRRRVCAERRGRDDDCAR